MSNKNHYHKDVLSHLDQPNQQAPQDLSRKVKSLTAQAIDESIRIAHDPSVASYSTIESLREALDQ